MFELLDDAQRKEQRAAIVRPKYAVVAIFWLILVGTQAGILIGRRDSDPLKWLSLSFNVILLFVCLGPLFREIYRLLKKHEVE